MSAANTQTVVPIKPAASEWKRITLDDVRNPPEERFLVGSLFPMGKASALYGPQGVCKSGLLAQLAFTTAAGATSFLGMPVHDTAGGTVLIYSAEDTFADWQRKAATVGHGFPNVHMERALDRLFVLDNTEGIARLTELVTRRNDLGDGASTTVTECYPTAERMRIIAKAQEVGAVLIILETASRLVPKEDNEDMAALMAAAGHIAAETGAAVLISHHPGKEAAKANDSRAESARGGGAFINNSRTAVSLFPADEPTLAALRERGFQFADDSVVRLEHTKGTSSVPCQPPIVLIKCGTPFGAYLQLPELVAQDPSLMHAHEARAARAEKRKAETFCLLYDKVQEMREGGPVSKRKLRDSGCDFGVSKREIESLVDAALSAKVLTVEKKDANGRVLDLGLGHRPMRATPCDPAKERYPDA